jgi:alpha-beta hydrolase superfamily lysophospholipase
LRSEGFFFFYADGRPVQLANGRLDALRAYAELAQALFPRSVPTLSLEQAGFGRLQSQKLVKMIGLQAEV